MLSIEYQRALTRVCRGTPMGELLRRYWHPVAPVLELREKKVKPVTLLGESLVLFSSTSGRIGLVSRSCAHRGADLSYGWMDGDALRCPYHGWAYDASGHCVEQPFEQAAGAPGFSEKTGIASYPTVLVAGLVWAYLGPGDPPHAPNLEPFAWNHGFVEISLATLPCNWFQCHENGVDPVHFEWVHTNWSSVQCAPENSEYEPRHGPRHVAVDFVETEFGFINMRQFSVDGSAPTEDVEGGVICMWPYTLVTGRTIEWRVPIDDVSTMNLIWHYSPLPEDVKPQAQDPEAIPYWYGPIEDPESGRYLTSHLLNQDYAVWAAQGPVVDRTRERLGRSDVGLIRLRRRYLEEIERVAAGEDPPGVYRGGTPPKPAVLPIRRKWKYTEGISREEFESGLARGPEAVLIPYGYESLQAGRPEAVRKMYELAGRRDDSEKNCPGRFNRR
jgi:5,5'-dehydrodivanillate O-demethylase oxygenase subunit